MRSADHNQVVETLAPHRSLEHAELVPQGEVLGGERCAGAEEEDAEQPEKADYQRAR
jgi:hypothetical protein